MTKLIHGTIKPDYRLRAIMAHGDQRYGEHHYSFHLAFVEMIMIRHRADLKILAKSQGLNFDFWRATAWLHDSLEDTELTFNEIKQDYTLIVADTVEGVTGRGPNRKARNADIYDKLAVQPLSRVLKVADRLANVSNAKRHRQDKFEMYAKEYPVFRGHVQKGVPAAMMAELDALFA